MAFQGSLKELPLPDIIQLVSVSGKTGMFTLNDGAQEGRIYLRGGQMVHASVGEIEGEDAIYALSLWSNGEFRFSPGTESARESVHKSNTNLLMEAARRMDEWRVLSKKIPSIDMVPAFVVSEHQHEQITLNPQEWRVLSKIDEHRSIDAVAKALAASPFDVAKVLYGLITAGLILLRSASEVRSRESAQSLVHMLEKVRGEAEQIMGEAGTNTLNKHYRIARSEIENGNGEAALHALISECEKAISLLKGAAHTKTFQDRVRKLVTT